MTTLIDSLKAGYQFSGPTVTLGAPLADGKVLPEPKIGFPLAMMNRHGLIAGATGTGKTKTLQLLAEQLSAAGVPVFVADLKGDLSGIAVPGSTSPAVDERAKSIGIPWSPRGNPTDYVSLTGNHGAQLRATVSSFGPLLLSRVLELNDTQASVLSLVFKACDDQGLLLLDFDDLRMVLKFLSSAEGKSTLAEYGGMSTATVGVLLRKMVELEEQGAKAFFGEPEFDVHDLLHLTSEGKGAITCLELTDSQDKPALFSTFLMWLLAELYQNLPEVGDLAKPKLVFFFDEAHLLFNGASKAFLTQVEQVVRLIRSKGVGVFFITQTPKDVPDEILAQLSNRVQHALRAHTPEDEDALRATVRTYPKTPFYDLQQTIMSLGIGEAIVTGLDSRGVPTPVAATRIAPPASRMGPLTEDEFTKELASSDFAREYGTPVNRESAFEMLTKRLQSGQPAAGQPTTPFQPGPAAAPKAGKSWVTALGATFITAMTSTAARTVGRELVRGALGMLTGKGTRGSSRSSRW